MKASDPLVFACVDVGSKSKTGWALLANNQWQSGTDLQALVVALDSEIKAGSLVALGFECPLYVPRRAELADLLRQRAGEAGKPWSAGAGAGALAVGLAQTQWLLRQIKALSPSLKGTTRWADFSSGDSALLVWEAFVSRTAGFTVPPGRLLQRSEHELDAAVAVVEFASRLQADDAPLSDLEGGDVLSLAGFQLVVAGLASDESLLREPCIVVRAAKPRWPGFEISNPERVWKEIEDRDYLQPIGTAWDRVYRTLRAAWQADPRGMEGPPVLMILGGAAFVNAEGRAEQWSKTLEWGKKYGIDARFVALADDEKVRSRGKTT